jgi:immune inhibitor A
MNQTPARANRLYIILAILGVFLCGCLVLAIGAAWWLGTHQIGAVLLPTASWTPSPLPTQAAATGSAVTPAPTPSPPAASTNTVGPSPQVTAATTPTPGGNALPAQEVLPGADLPERDIRLLAERLKKTGPIPEVVRQVPPEYSLGDEAEFWVGNMDTMQQFKVVAVLRYITPHLYMWVEKGISFDSNALARSAEDFEQHVYPTNRAFFGHEWSPGVDSDVHLHILHSTQQHMGSSVAGYYSSADEYSHLANPYSNEREMFYVSLEGSMRPGTDFYEAVLAHEFQHMIHWANDRNEATWVNEGCSELAAYLNGYDPGGFDWIFVADPDVQLTSWPALGDAAAHYGGSYLFMAYFLDRFGDDLVKQVIADPANGIAGFETVLKGAGLTFDDVFADWLVANYVDNAGGRFDLGDSSLTARYTYPDHVVGPVAIDVTHDSYPVQRESTVHQYAADYIQLKGNSDLQIDFQGDQQARLVPTDAHSGQYAWWSNRGDDSDATLTRSFDLRSVDRATLQAWMWYDIEEDWDYGYVEASTNGGQTWDILPGASTTTSNPNGNSFGAGYTGESGGWIQESFDLSPHAGQQVLVRFECVTDDAVNLSGWLIDDISVPELGYSEDLESGDGGWEGLGFIRTDNRVAQRYLVQVIAFGQQMHVLNVPLDETQHATVELRGLGQELDSAVLVISAVAPATTELAAYRYTIQPLAR